jgi:hypothetical protein
VLADTAAVTYYVRGNVVDDKPEWTANNLLLFDRNEFQGRKLWTAAAEPFSTPAVRTTSAEEAFVRF